MNSIFVKKIFDFTFEVGSAKKYFQAFVQIIKRFFSHSRWNYAHFSDKKWNTGSLNSPPGIGSRSTSLQNGRYRKLEICLHTAATVHKAMLELLITIYRKLQRIGLKVCFVVLSNFHISSHEQMDWIIWFQFAVFNCIHFTVKAESIKNKIPYNYYPKPLIQQNGKAWISINEVLCY